MTKRTFSSLVKQYFHYLTDEYGFVATEILINPTAFDDGNVVFQSAHASISARLDRFSVLIQVRPSQQPKASTLSLHNIVDFLTQGQSAAILNFPDPPLLSVVAKVQGWIDKRALLAASKGGDLAHVRSSQLLTPSLYERRIERYLAGASQVLRRYAEPILRGDFTWWLDACKYFRNWMQADYRSKTGQELPEAAYQSLTEYIRSQETGLADMECTQHRHAADLLPMNE